MNYHNFWFSNVPNYTVPHMPLEPGAPCRMQCSMGSEHWKVTANVWKRSVFAVTQIWVWVLPLQLVSSAESLFSHLWKGNGIYPRGDTKAVWNNIEIMPLGVWYLEGPQPVSFLDWSGFCAVHACLLSVYYMPDAEWDSGKQQQIRWPLLSGDLQHSRVCSKTAAKRLHPDQVSPVGSLIAGEARYGLKANLASSLVNAFWSWFCHRLAVGTGASHFPIYGLESLGGGCLRVL